jgi:hypothetical protein
MWIAPHSGHVIRISFQINYLINHAGATPEARMLAGVVGGAVQAGESEHTPSERCGLPRWDERREDQG